MGRGCTPRYFAKSGKLLICLRVKKSEEKRLLSIGAQDHDHFKILRLFRPPFL
jgi:hypothetical protein